jgi:hypothetical protein
MSDGQLAMNTNLASPGLFFKDSNGDLVKVGPVHVGSTAPNVSPAVGGQSGNSKGEQWLDTSSSRYVFKIWDGTAWRTEDGEFVNVSGDVMTGALGIIAGTAAAPGLYVSGDTNTGIYSPGADQVAISTNGSGRLFVDASGNVGIGATPDGQLSLLGANSNTPRFRIQHPSTDKDAGISAYFDGSGTYLFLGSNHYVNSSGSNTKFDATSGSSAWYLDGSGNGIFYNSSGSGSIAERLRIDSSGRLGLGTSSPSSLLEVASGADAILTLTGNVAGGNVAAVDFKRNGGTVNASIRSESAVANDAGEIYFSTRPVSGSLTERVRIDREGRVGIGTTSPATTLDVNGGAQVLGSVSGYPGAELRLGATSASIDSAISTQSTGSPFLFFDHRGTSNTGGFAWRAGTGAATERMRIDTSGRLLVGTSSAQGSSVLQLQTSGGATVRIARDLPPGSLGSGNFIGSIDFTDNAGNNYSRIIAEADGAAGSGDYPGRLVFSTTADGASSPTERMRINEKGALKATTNSGTYVSSTSIFHELIGNHTGEATVILKNFSGSYDRPVVEVDCVRAANSAYSHIRAYSGSFADTEFLLRGDGNGLCDGAWTGGGADYAEYFEWNDGNSDDNDRRGISVVLEGDKIRPALAGEDPIGVISGNPSVVGDSAWNKWSGKHLRDEFGSYLLDENGDRQQNPAYDPDQEYVPREQRPEWDCVGLMGKLRIRKGQVTGSRWIKMRDISDSVEEWLVR